MPALHAAQRARARHPDQRLQELLPELDRYVPPVRQYRLVLPADSRYSIEIKRGRF
jgi:hypothetical protein